MIPRIAARVVSACARRSLYSSVYTTTARSRHVPTLSPRMTAPRWQLQARAYAAPSKSVADEIIDEIQEQYATAKDEFEIAVEETEKKTVYAAEDRAAAQEELKKLKELYDGAINSSVPEVANEIKSRVGQRIRELDQAIQGLEQSAMED